jgi:hypothetical protein
LAAVVFVQPKHYHIKHFIDNYLLVSKITVNKDRLFVMCIPLEGFAGYKKGVVGYKMQPINSYGYPLSILHYNQ